MTEMSNKEVLDFNRPEEAKDFPVQVDGTSALKLDIVNEVLREEKGRDAQIGEIREFVKPERPQAVLPLTNTDAGVQRAPRGVVGPVGNQGRETSGGDRTGGRRKKGLGVRITAGVMAVVAGAGIGYGVFKDKINSFFGGGVDPNDLPPAYPVETPGEMPSQSENIESPTPSAEVTPEVTKAPTPTLDEFGFSEERRAELDQQIKDFLNYEGEYSKENIQKYLLPKSDDEYYNLGLVISGNTSNRVQAWLFDYIEKDGDLILLAGFDGKDGQRFVTALNIPLHFKELNPNAGVGFIKLSSWNSVYISEETDGSSGDIELIKSRLSKDNPVLLNFVSKISSDEKAMEVGGDAFVTINQYYRNNLLYTNDLLSKIDQNGKEIVGKLNIGNEKIQKIENISEISDSNNMAMPFVGVIVYVQSMF